MRLTDSDPLRSQVLSGTEDKAYHAKHNQSTMPKSAMKIDLPMQGTWSGFLEPTREDRRERQERVSRTNGRLVSQYLKDEGHEEGVMTSRR